jgi:hypothetical protein
LYAKADGLRADTGQVTGTREDSDRRYDAIAAHSTSLLDRRWFDPSDGRTAGYWVSRIRK